MKCPSNFLLGFVTNLLHNRGVQSFLWQRTTPVVGRYANQTWKNNKSVTTTRINYSVIFILPIIYKRGRGPLNATWRAAWWRPLLSAM
jgi:hypothetical protein